MKKRHFSLLTIFSILSTVLSAQISIKQADNIVQEYIEKEITEYYWLYSNENIMADKNGATTISTWNKKSVSIDNSCFVYFIDERPYANWAHPCRYLFVDKSNGQIYEKKATTPPENMKTWKMITPLPQLPTGTKFDFSKSASNLRSGINPQNCYAVIISGGYDEFWNWERYWNDCSAIYSALIHLYGYLKNHIYVLISDGTDPAIDRHLNDWSYDSSPLDLDGDGLDDIQYAATKNNITTVFNTLANILTPDDHLFIFTTDHGDTIPSTQEATLELWYERITASEFAAEVNKVNAGSISIVMEQCFSGGFIPHLAKQGRTIATACSAIEESWAMPPSYTYNEFVYHWTAAVAGFTPSGSSVNADYNNDGYISMKEAFDYANTNDNANEIPQYSSIKAHLGDCLTLLGTQVATTVNFTGTVAPPITVTSDTTIGSCGDINVQYVTVTNGATLTFEAEGNINVQDVTVKNNSKLILDAGGEVNIIGDFDVELGSEFEIKYP